MSRYNGSFFTFIVSFLLSRFFSRLHHSIVLALCQHVFCEAHKKEAAPCCGRGLRPSLFGMLLIPEQVCQIDSVEDWKDDPITDKQNISYHVYDLLKGLLFSPFLQPPFNQEHVR